MSHLKKWHIAITLLLAWFFMSSCERFERDCERMQNALHAEMKYAEQRMDDVARVLLTNDFDSIWYYTHLDKGLVWYVYAGNRMVYWSEAWLSESGYPIRKTQAWQYGEWGNAQGVYTNRKVGDYTLRVVLPLKYNFKVQPKGLENSWVMHPDSRATSRRLHRAMRRLGDDVVLSDGYKQQHRPVSQEEEKATAWFELKNTKGERLFLLGQSGSVAAKADKREAVDDGRDREAFESFSYQAILSQEKYESAQEHMRMRTYYGVTILLSALLLGFALWALIRYKGVQNMPLSNRLQLVLISSLIATLLLVFMVSVWHMRKVFVDEQKARLEETARHIQTQLQDLYFWDMGLSRSHSSSLNIDLRDMSFDYQTDINVYDINGRLLGSSTPRAFELGLLSRQMSAESFFVDKTEPVREECLGEVEYLAAYIDFVNGNDACIGYISVPSFISANQMRMYVGSYVGRLLPVYIVLLLLCILIVWVVSRMVSHPLMALSEQMKNYQLGDAGYHISYRYQDEVGELIKHYNEMLDALADSTDKLARSEHEGAWRTMARQVAHEINNSLTPMKLTLQQLQRWKGTERFEQAFDRTAGVLIEQIDNMSNIAGSFSSFAKMPEVHVEVVDIAQKMYDYIVLLRNTSDVVPVRYVGPEKGVMVMADAGQITQVFQNIVRNAVQAMEGQSDGDIIIILKDISPAQCEEKGLNRKDQWVELSFSDNGPGIKEEVREKVFVPNFTTKNTGAGLGLAISRNIVEGCGGKICFQTSDKGTTFYIYLRKKR